MTQPTLNITTIKAGDVLITESHWRGRHYVLLIEKMGNVMIFARTLHVTGEWGKAMRQKLDTHAVVANLGPLSPHADLELLYKDVERIDSDYRHAVVIAAKARRQHFDELARNFTRGQ
jgi:hypothetical protein